MTKPPSYPEPPRWAMRFLRWYCDPRFLEEVEGDLCEIFDEQVEQYGIKRANRRFIGTLLPYLRPYFWSKRSSSPNDLPTIGMFKNYFTIAWRHFTRRTGYTAINLFGLAIGMAACFLILEYVDFEQSYDRFHSRSENIYRVAQDRYNHGVVTTQWAAGAAAIGGALDEHFDEVKNVVKLYEISGNMTFKEHSFREEKMYFASESFFQVFSFPLIRGNADEVLKEPYKAVISETAARKYFGDEDPIGKTLRRNNANDFIVTGVFEDVPNNSHVKFDILLSYATWSEWTEGGADTEWYWDGFYTYVQLQDGTDPEVFEAKIPEMIKPYTEEEFAESSAGVSYSLQNVGDIHLDSDLMMEFEANGDRRYVYLLTIIAFFILGIAWINYINLSTAKSMERAREVGMRKVLGSHRMHLVQQFLIEAFLTNTLASVIAIGMLIFALPVFNEITGMELELNLLFQAKFWGRFFLVLIAGSLLSGLYPAFVLASFQPIKVLKGKLNQRLEGIWLRRGLVLLQFGVSALLIASTLTVYKQLSFMQDQELGVNIEQTMIIKSPFIADSTYQERLNAFKTELMREPGMRSVTASTAVPGRKAGWNAGGIRKLSDPETETNQYRVIGVDDAFIDAYELDILEGRKFSKDFSTETGNVIFNESAVTLMGFDDAESVLGTDIYFWGDTFKIVGIIADYHQQSLKEAYDPMILRYIPDNRNFYSLKIKAQSGEQFAQSLEHANTTWSQFFPASPMDYFFLDEHFGQQYQTDQQFGQVFGIFTLLALFVAALGLLGLSAFAITQRAREISIRKVLGASIGNLFYLLTKEFVILALIAAVIFLPLSWIGMNAWLTGYAFHIDLGMWFLLIPLATVILISLLSISYQTFRAVYANPIDAIRHE